VSDRERLLALLRDFGVTPSANADAGDVELAPGEGGVNGYWGLVCAFRFTPEGAFKGVGVWE
jgi:hypothetical protein